MRTIAPVLISILIAALPIARASACGKDTDCKGERVCDEGRCVFPGQGPAATPIPAPSRPAAPQAEPDERPVPPRTVPAQDLDTVRRASVHHGGLAIATRAAPRPKVLGGYLEIAYLHNHSAFAELKGWPAHSGLRAAGYRAFTNKLHLGGYLAYAGVGDAHLLATGISLKAGSWIQERAWLGLVLDHGIEFMPQSGGFALMQVSPRLHLDVRLFSGPAATVAASLSLGPTILANGDHAGGTQTVMLGLTIGR